MINESGPKPVVLIAEHESSLVRFAAAVLDDEGYTVLTAEDSFRAAEIADHFKGDIHLALCGDVPGASGTELRAVIAAKRPNTKVVLLSEDQPFSRMPVSVLTFPKPFRLWQCLEVARQSKF